MRASIITKNLLLAGMVSLTIASCGGGGSSADDAMEKLADFVDENTTTQSNTLAPDALSAGMKFYITGASRPDSVVSILSATSWTDGSTGEYTYTYRKITDASARLVLNWSGAGSESYSESYTLAFKDKTSGNAVWIWTMDGKEQVEDVKFRLEGRDSTPESSGKPETNTPPATPPATTPDVPADDSSSGEDGRPGSSDNTVIVPSAPNDDLAPSSLARGMQIRVTQYLTFRCTNGITGIVTVRNTPYDARIVYRKTGKNTATLDASYMAPSSRGYNVQHTAVVNLTFKSKDNGASQYTIENIDSASFTNGIRRVTGGGQFFYEKTNP